VKAASAIRLIRPEHVLTAMADAAAGYFIILLAPSAFDGWTLVKVVLIVACLHAAGVVFSDAFDLEENRKARGEGPLAAGDVTLQQAFFLGVFLILSALFLAMMLGFCRFLNMQLGMSGNEFFRWQVYDTKTFVPPLIVMVYVVIAALVHGAERKPEARKFDLTIAGGSVVLLLAAALYFLGFNWYATALVALLALFVLYTLSEAIQTPADGTVRIAWQTMLRCIIFLDASLIIGLCAAPRLGVLAGSIVALMILPALLFGMMREETYDKEPGIA